MKNLILAGILAMTALTGIAEAGTTPTKPRIEPFVPTIELRVEEEGAVQIQLAQRRPVRVPNACACVRG